MSLIPMTGPESDGKELPSYLGGSFINDSPSQLYDKLVAIDIEVNATARKIVQLSQAIAKSQSDYEEGKNQTLLELYVEENEAEKAFREAFPRATYKAPTDAQRTSRYRSIHAEKRRQWQEDKYQLEAEKEYLKALLGIQMSIEARAKLMGSVDGHKSRISA